MLKIHHIRNATMVIETGKEVILVDPMLGPEGTMPSFTLFRFKRQRNPTAPFPEKSRPVLDRVTHCLITHKHPDHIDEEGLAYLKNRQIPVTCSLKDASFFKKKGLKVTQTLDYNRPEPYLGGTIEGIHARHGYGFVAIPAGNVMGYYLELPGQPSLYLSSDTIYTDEVASVLRDKKPDISVVAAGSAQFDIFKPLLMTKEDVLRFIKDSPGKVIANHMEAVNHCPTTRSELKEACLKAGLSNKVFIPADGEVISL